MTGIRLYIVLLLRGLSIVGSVPRLKKAAKMPGMKFCRECNNMLYAREDKEAKQLIYACRNCPYQEAATSNCIYVNEIVKDSATKLEIIQPEVSLDPTLQRSHDTYCRNCGGNEAVFFQTHDGTKDAGLGLIFVCANLDCGHKWIG